MLVTDCKNYNNKGKHENVYNILICQPGVRQGRPAHSFNVVIVLAKLLNEGCYTGHKHHQGNISLPVFGSSCWQTAQTHLLILAKKLGQHTCQELVDAYLAQKPDEAHLVLSGDFGWSQQRQGNAGAYIIMDTKTKKVLHQVILVKEQQQTYKGVSQIIQAGNYCGTSKGMEGEAFQCTLRWLEKKGLLPYFKAMVCDQDSSVLQQLQDDPRTSGHVKVLLDPGHTKKNFVKDLNKAFGLGKRYAGFAERIG